MERINQDVDTQIQEMNQQRQSNKRKRDSPGINGRAPKQGPTPDHDQHHDNTGIDTHNSYYPQQNGNEEYGIQNTVARHVADINASSSTAAAALAASMPQLTVPQPTELSFPSTNSGNEEERQVDSSFDFGPDSNQQHAEGAPYMSAYPGTNGDQAQTGGGTTPGKPVVGTDEWHKVRKDNHKEVERRRRETINEGINELAKIVPGCDKNKGAILQRGVQYITQLKENESRNIEKWTLEKMLTDQAIEELLKKTKKLEEDLVTSMGETERWKTKFEAAGLTVAAEEATAQPGRSR